MADALPNDIRRGGKPLAVNTQRAYRMAFNRVTEVLGDRKLNAFDGDVIRDYVAKRRREESKPATICLDLAVIKLVVESKTDKGNPVYPLRINKNYARVPEIIPDEQKTPLAMREHVETALGDPISGHVAIEPGSVCASPRFWPYVSETVRVLTRGTLRQRTVESSMFEPH